MARFPGHRCMSARVVAGALVSVVTGVVLASHCRIVVVTRQGTHRVQCTVRGCQRAKYRQQSHPRGKREGKESADGRRLNHGQ